MLLTRECVSHVWTTRVKRVDRCCSVDKCQTCDTNAHAHVSHVCTCATRVHTCHTSANVLKPLCLCLSTSGVRDSGHIHTCDTCLHVPTRLRAFHAACLFVFLPAAYCGHLSHVSQSVPTLVTRVHTCVHVFTRVHTCPHVFTRATHVKRVHMCHTCPHVSHLSTHVTRCPHVRHVSTRHT